MIVEYFGIPGSGKTYQANLYKIQLLKEEKAFIDISRYSGMPLWLKVFYKVADYAVGLIPKYRRIKVNLWHTCVTNYTGPRFLSLSQASCIKDIVLSVFLHDVFGKMNKVVLNDEGMLQRIVTFAVLYDVCIDKLIYICKPEFTFVKSIFVVAPLETAYNNIKTRNRHVCEMDEMNDEALKLYLKAFADICEKINNSTFNVISINDK